MSPFRGRGKFISMIQSSLVGQSDATDQPPRDKSATTSSDGRKDAQSFGDTSRPEVSKWIQFFSATFHLHALTHEIKTKWCEAKNNNEDSKCSTKCCCWFSIGNFVWIVPEHKTSKEIKLTECLHALCPLPAFAFTFPFTAPVKMRMKFWYEADSGKRIISSDTILQRYEDNNFLRKCAKNTHDN